MRIVVAGASGLVGSALVPALEGLGHQVIRLVRGSGSGAADEAPWDPAGGQIDSGLLEAAEAVICLSGASIADGRWTGKRKRLLLESRVASVRTLAEAIATLDHPPATMIAASAVGYYGDQGNRLLEDGAQPGEGFLANICRRWEAAAAVAREKGVRVVHPRIGMVLSSRGGALDKMLPPFRLGLGGPVGSGRQWMSWITLEDLVATLLFCLGNSALEGGVNAVAPEPVRNRSFARALGRALGRPAFLPAPAFVLRLALGEMADELLLASQRVVPTQLLAAGFEFRSPEVGEALAHVLNRGLNRGLRSDSKQSSA